MCSGRVFMRRSSAPGLSVQRSAKSMAKFLSIADFGPQWAGQETGNFILGFGALVNDGVNGGDDWHVDVIFAGKPRGAQSRMGAFDDTTRGCESIRNASAFAKRQAEGIIARLPARAGEQKIAKTGQAGQRFGLGPQFAAKACQLGKAAGSESGTRAVTQMPAVGNAAGNRQYIFERAADLDAQYIIGCVDAE